MSTFSKLRELVTLARNLEAEGRRLREGSEGRMYRMGLAEEYRAKAAWIAGRITDEQYGEFLAAAAS